MARPRARSRLAELVWRGSLCFISAPTSRLADSYRCSRISIRAIAKTSTPSSLGKADHCRRACARSLIFWPKTSGSTISILNAHETANGGSGLLKHNFDSGPWSKDRRPGFRCCAQSRRHVVGTHRRGDTFARRICQSCEARSTKATGGEGGIAAQLSETQYNQALVVRPREPCVPILCPEVDWFFALPTAPNATSGVGGVAPKWYRSLREISTKFAKLIFCLARIRNRGLTRATAEQKTSRHCRTRWLP